MKQPDTIKLMFHSDQSVQYSAELFKKTWSIYDITQSMSRRGNCWDNSVQERFFRILKSDYLNGLSFINHSSVIGAVEYYIRYYNNIKNSLCHWKYNSSQETTTIIQSALEFLQQFLPITES